MVSCPFLHICLRSKEDTTLCIQRPYPPIRDSMPTAWASGPPDHDAAGLIVDRVFSPGRTQERKLRT